MKDLLGNEIKPFAGPIDPDTDPIWYMGTSDPRYDEAWAAYVRRAADKIIADQ